MGATFGFLHALGRCIGQTYCAFHADRPFVRVAY